MARKITTDEFIQKSRSTHGNSYDYTNAIYTGALEKIEIICKTHGVFWQCASDHFYGRGCPGCGKEKSGRARSLTHETFMSRITEEQKLLYDYTKTLYKGTENYIVVTCKTHGDFKLKAGYHLQGQGCAKCHRASQKLTTEKFIEKARVLHGENRYIYDRVEYVTQYSKVEIICPRHGNFVQKAGNHLIGHGCRKCFIEDKMRPSMLFTQEDFIQKSQEIHGSRYDYSQANYTHCKEKVEIICLDHGLFTQSAEAHYRGQGCPRCKVSQGEREVAQILDRYGIPFETEKTFQDCVSPISKRKLPFDFYLVDTNKIIEYDGLQHFEPIDFWGGEEELSKRKYNDGIKNAYCLSRGIQILRIPYSEQDIEQRMRDEGII